MKFDIIWISLGKKILVRIMILEFFTKHKTTIFRVGGAFLLVVGFIVQFWVTPKEGVSANDIAAANVARMEAQVAGSSKQQQKQQRSSESPFLKEYKTTQAKQMRYAMYLLMAAGVGFLAYSFLARKKEE